MPPVHMRPRRGPKSAIIDTAHRCVRVLSHMLKHRTSGRDLSTKACQQGARDGDIANLPKRATKLGFTSVMSLA